MRDRVDAVVVGAGIAGLTAARNLKQRGHSVLVLEARDRVGGRTTGHTLQNGFTVEMGGAYVGPYQTAVMELIDDLGLETFLTYDTGEAVSIFDRTRSQFRTQEATFGFPEESLPEMGRVQQELEALTESVPLSSPWLSPNAAELDRQTFDAWLTRTTHDEPARIFYRTLIADLWCREAWEVSLLHVVFYVKSGGLLDNMLAATGGNQESRILGGSHLISQRMAAELGEGVVRLNAPVRAIAQDANGVRVVFDGGEASARRVIVALPPALAGRLRYDPPLPAARDAVTQQTPMGSAIKVQVVYDTPFWRDEGLSGFSTNFDGAPSFTIDGSPADGSCGVLTGFIVAAHARELSAYPAEQRRAMVIDSLVVTFGPRAADVIEYVEKDWTMEEYTRGCYGGHPAVGVWTQHGAALTEPVGRIHWAGTETADVSTGYMDGAARSGHRAAAEVLAALPADLSKV